MGVDTEYNHMGDIYDIAFSEILGDTIGPVQRKLIQPPDVSCPREFGNNITPEQLRAAPTLLKCHKQLRSECFKENVTVVQHGNACDQGVHQENARKNNLADFAYTGLCSLTLARRLREAGSLVCQFHSTERCHRSRH